MKQKQAHRIFGKFCRVNQLERHTEAKGLARGRDKRTLLQESNGFERQCGAPGQLGVAELEGPAARRDAGEEGSERASSGSLFHHTYISIIPVSSTTKTPSQSSKTSTWSPMLLESSTPPRPRTFPFPSTPPTPRCWITFRCRPCRASKNPPSPGTAIRSCPSTSPSPAPTSTGPGPRPNSASKSSTKVSVPPSMTPSSSSRPSSVHSRRWGPCLQRLRNEAYRPGFTPVCGVRHRHSSTPVCNSRAAIRPSAATCFNGKMPVHFELSN
jgi:hypothetical protein